MGAETQHQGSRGRPLSGPAADIAQLNAQLGLQNRPFGLARQAVDTGNWADVSLKQLLYEHYRIFITDVWHRFSEWRESAKNSGAPLALLYPDPTITPIWKSDNLLSGSPRLPKHEVLVSCMRPIDHEYVGVLKAAQGPQKVVAAFGLAELSWKTFLYRWELEHRRGTIETRSTSDQDLYRACYDLLVKEQSDHLREVLKQGLKLPSGIPSKVRNRIIDGRVSALEEQTRRSFYLTNIMGEAISFALNAWHRVPVEFHTSLPQVAATSSKAASFVTNGIILASLGDPSLPKDEVFTMATSWAGSGQQKADILRRMAEGRSNGNSSDNPEVAGCPALGTPAFMGSRMLVEEIRQVVGF